MNDENIQILLSFNNKYTAYNLFKDMVQLCITKLSQNVLKFTTYDYNILVMNK